jgi:2-methoxy-6-polyprenyl-1,4-benzoquinol methylase
VLPYSYEPWRKKADPTHSVREAGFQTGAMREGKGGAWVDYTFGVATMWTGVKA